MTFAFRIANLRQIKKFKNRECPHGIYYYSNHKLWMTTEIMTFVLAKINGKMEAA